MVERFQIGAAFIEWSDQFSVAIPSIDKQHKVLIGMINTLNEALGSGSARQQ